MSFSWGNRSLSRLNTCHPLLVTLFQRVIKRKDLPCDMTILCGHRNQKEQDAAFASGNSKLKWPRSKHNSTPSMAVDVAPMLGAYASWDWDLYNKIAPLIKDEWGKMVGEGLTGGAALQLSWGGDWSKFKDGPHWELSA